jgi:hypothetical protein
MFNLDLADLLSAAQVSLSVDQRTDAEPLEDRQVEVEAYPEIEAKALVPGAFRRKRDAKVHRLPLATDIPPLYDDDERCPMARIAMKAV